MSKSLTAAPQGQYATDATEAQEVARLEKWLRRPRRVVCPVCTGQGEPGRLSGVGNGTKCRHCHGTGMVTIGGVK